MKDKTHLEQIERWGKFIKTNPNGWKKEHTQFINAQIEKSWRFYERLEKMPGGKEKIKKLRSI